MHEQFRDDLSFGGGGGFVLLTSIEWIYTTIHCVDLLIVALLGGRVGWVVNVVDFWQEA